MRRQARYARTGVRCLWLLRQPGFPVDFALPAARIGGSLERGFSALVPTGSGEQRVPMRDFLAAAFTGRLRFGVPVGVTARISVRAGHMFCWSCGAETAIVTGIDVLLGPHEYCFSIPDLTTYSDLAAQVSSKLPEDLQIGRIKHRFSRTQQRFYLSNGCAHCDVLVGEFYEHDAWDNQQEVFQYPIRITGRWRQAIEANDSYAVGWVVY